MGINEFNITVLEDGTVKIETSSFEGAVHLAADKALAWIEREMGGESKRERLGHTHHHHHHDEKKHVKA